MLPIFKNVVERSTTKNHHPVGLLSVLSKVLEKLLIIGLPSFGLPREMLHFFLISSMVLGLLDQLQIFWQLYLIELLGFLTGLELIKL